jgi:hypothetical protein
VTTQLSTAICILVFKTNIRYEIDMPHIQSVLSTLYEIERWNVDKHDADNILRIEARAPIAQDVITALNHAGYACTELED